MTSVTSLSSVRLAGLDHLRLMVVVLVVVLHAAMSYMSPELPWWYVVDPPGSLAFTVAVLAIDVPIMFILFFLAGYFAWMSLVRSGSRRFIAAKARRIALPWLIGVLILAPPLAYLIVATRGMGEGLVAFWTGAYWGPFYQQSVYWFLGVLFLFFLVVAALYRIPALRGWIDADGEAYLETSRRRRYLALGVFWLATAAMFFVVHRRVPLDTWSNWGYVFMVQPNRIAVYGAYFALGFIAGRGRWLHQEWLRDERAWPRLSTWGVLFVVSMVAYLANRILVVPDLRAVATIQAVTALQFTATVFSGLLFSLSLARTALENLGPRWTRAARYSYWIYFLHPLVLYPVIWALRDLTPLSGLTAFLIAVVATLAASWGGAELLSGLLQRTAPAEKSLS
ncbi:MAG TPA: acyltransferase family protein [Alkalispirochaeta sp.]|nr:acyltransferase family protein [Alkalispirochaeta sp.]